MKPKIISPLSPSVLSLKKRLRKLSLHTVCEEANCPNIGECFSRGVATFMIMGDVCTRNCPYCDVSHGKPKPLDESEPENVAKMVEKLKLKYVVITSVDRDDLPDGGASHFAKTVKAIKKLSKNIFVEVLIPDFKGKKGALKVLIAANPDVINHNIETVPSLYPKVRHRGDYQYSLNLLKKIKELSPKTPTKSGLMVGLGESKEEIIKVMEDLRKVNCDILTIGQYLQPSLNHLPVAKYYTDEEFNELKEIGYSLGFKEVYSGKLVRSSYRADIIFDKIKSNHR